MEEQILIIQVNPTTFDFQNYTEQDNILISSSRLDTSFTASSDYIEYYAYDENLNLIYPANPNVKAVQVNTFSVINGDTIIYPDIDLENAGFNEGTYYSTYNFYRRLLGSNITVNYYISEISSDRTELRLKSNAIEDSLIISSSNEFIQYREVADHFVDFLLNFGNDQQVIANNIKLDIETEIEPSILIKLYEPLPPQFQLKSTLWVVEEISSPQAYNVVFPFIIYNPQDYQFIKGPNYSLQIKGQTGTSGQDFSLDTLIDTNMTSSYNQLQGILDQKSININVDYTNFENFVNFSSAQTRLENFYYKVAIIQSASAQLPSLTGNGSEVVYSSSAATLTTEINYIIKTFDGYEQFMYYNSGSDSAYPKMTSSPPYILYPTGSTEVLTWIGSADPDNQYYGGQALKASVYDEENPNFLFNAIPEYLKSDPNNEKYELFIDMVGQQYDNTWLYTKDLTNRFDNDNRLDYGISKDLVADAIRDFGIRLYANNFNTNDLYTAFLGITPSGSLFPFPYMTGSYPTPSGYEYITTAISASNDIVPLDNVNKSLYKRIYHNLPYILKTKGTIAGLRALITSYGIPDTILRINEFGGRDRNEGRDWDFSEYQWNYAFHSDTNSYLESSFIANDGFQSVDKAPKSIQFRFKTSGIPTSSLYQQLWVANSNTSFITLEYTGSSMASGSYSGSVPDNYNQYGTLKFYPDGLNGITQTSSIYLPFFDEGWWSVMATVDYNNTETASLYTANRIGNDIGFSGSSHVTDYIWQYWETATNSFLPSSSAFLISGNSHLPFTGSYQELRYWDTPLDESRLYDYVMNPYSTQGNTINSTPDDLIFRASLGTTLETGSGTLTSIHPKVTGSWLTTQSFSNNSSNYYITGSFIKNTEELFLNQTPGGIKNRITDKVHLVTTSIPSGSTLSPFRSVQQSIYPSGSAANINYLEIAFSPTDQVNDDIIAQIGNFSLGDYIGDPRQISESTYSYPDLDKLRDDYFLKYISSYDVNDFVRLIKFFDNSLFKMIEDFTPARTSLSSGVVIKQNLLERNKQRPAQVSTAVTMSTYYTGSPSNPYSDIVALVQQDQTLTGSVKAFARDYNPGSNDYPEYATISGSSIYVFDGGTGGVFEPFNTIFNAPISSSDQQTCLPWYNFTSSTSLVDANSAFGYFAFNPNISNPTTTMSINISNSLNDSNTTYLQYILSASNYTSQSVQLTIGPDGNNILYNIDYILDSQEGYGVGVYGATAYGVGYTSSYIMYLTPLANNITTPYTNGESLNVCFNLLGSPYSGKTASEVSASMFAYKYPGVVQDFNEYVYPTLGTQLPNENSLTTGTGQGLLTIPRIDQREFYNGEFPNSIPVGMKEICKTFFGQDSIIDYFFLIQWFNNISFPEQNFLTSSNLPQDGNVWFWADTVAPTFTGSGDPSEPEQPIIDNYDLIKQDTYLAVDSGGVYETTNFTYTGIGSGGKIAVLVSDQEIQRAYFSEPGQYSGNGYVLIPSQSLIDAGMPNLDTSLLQFYLDNTVLTRIPSYKVKYIKISNIDTNGEGIIPFIQDSRYVIFNLTGASDYQNNLIDGYQTWYIANTSLQDDNDPSTQDATLLIINEEPSSVAISSFDAAFYDLTFSASGQFIYEATQSGIDPNVLINSGITSSAPQGYFPPISGYPNESFFRGWASANYLTPDGNGNTIYVGTGSGYLYDPFGYNNFNTGSREVDNDNANPYNRSTYPWFMNAPASTLQVLSGSSLVGSLTANTLQLYTGSITSSAVQIGPYFNILTESAPILVTPLTTPNTIPVSPTLSTNCGSGLTSISNDGGPYSIPVITSTSTLTWSVYIDYQDGWNWISLITQTGTGSGIIYFSVDSGSQEEVYTRYSRTARIIITNDSNPTNNYSCTVTQIYNASDMDNPGFPSY